MGVVLKKYKGAWYAFINHNGARRSQKLATRKDDAKKLASQIEIKLAAGDLGIAAPGITFERFGNDWLNEINGALKPTSVRFYRSNLRTHILPVIKNQIVEEFNRNHCKDIIKALREKNVSRAVMKGALRTLSALLSHAVDHGAIRANPALRLGKFVKMVPGTVEHVKPLTAVQTEQLLAATQALDTDLWLLVLTAVRTGLRMGEIIGLQWGDLDLDAKALWVRRAVSFGYLGTPKNHQQRRVDLSTKLVEALSKRKGISPVAGDDWVFPEAEGRRWDESRLRKRFARIRRRAELGRDLRFHDLRHTYASLLLERGVSIIYVKEQLGHGSIKLTVDTYGHLVPGSQRATVDLLDEAARVPASQTHPADPEKPPVSA